MPTGRRTFDVTQQDPFPDPDTAYVNRSFPRGQALANWLRIVGASGTLGRIPVNTLRHDFNNAVPPSLLWMSLGAPPTGAFTYPMLYTFDTPVASSPTCGRVAFNDFHVENATYNTDLVFPDECTLDAMSPQEKLLEFMLFDLGSCAPPK